MPLFTCTVHIPTYTFIYVLKPSTGFELGSPVPLPRPITTTVYYLLLSQTFLMTLLTCALHSNHSNLVENTQLSLYLNVRSYCNTSFKGTVSRDFLLLVFFMNQFPPNPRVSHYEGFEFFRKFAEIFAAQG